MEIIKVAAKTIQEQVGGSAGDKNLETSIGSILNAIFGVIGVVAVIFIIIGGVNYMLSQGDPGKTKKARDTILYAVIGLLVTLLAFAIVNFVLKSIGGA